MQEKQFPCMILFQIEIFSYNRNKYSIGFMNFLVLKDMKLDFGAIDPNDKINGLIGLDFLIDAKSIIALVDFTIYKK